MPYLTTRPGSKEPSFTPDLFTRLTFVRVGSCEPALVTEFQYSKETGHVFNCVRERSESDVGYGRIISLNSWWWDLMIAMVNMSLGVFDITVTSSLLISLWGDDQIEKYGDHVYDVRWYFTVTWFTLMAISILLSVAEAWKEWQIRSNPRVGDITLLPGRAQMVLTFFALVIFTYFGVDALVRDIVIFVHPWKGVQPYAAIKMYGTRAHVVGWQNDMQFFVENKGGQQTVLLLKMVSKVVIVCFKAWIVYELPTPYTMWPCFTSLCSLSSMFYTWFGLMRKRSHYIQTKKKPVFKSLQDRLRSSPKSSASTLEVVARDPGRGPSPPAQTVGARSSRSSTDNGSPPLAVEAGKSEGFSGTSTAGGLAPIMSTGSEPTLVVLESTSSGGQEAARASAHEHQKWREAAFEKRHYGFMGVRTDVSSDECHRCGRWILDSSKRELHAKAVTFKVGDIVKLAPAALLDLTFHDAQKGPLRLGEAAKVVEVSEAVENYGARVRVEARTVGKPRSGTKTYTHACWWYDVAALELGQGTTGPPREVVCKDLRRAIKDLAQAVPDVRRLLDAAPPHDSLHARMLLSQILGPLCKIEGGPARSHAEDTDVRTLQEVARPRRMPPRHSPGETHSRGDGQPELTMEALRQENDALRADLDQLRKEFRSMSKELHDAQDRLCRDRIERHTGPRAVAQPPAAPADGDHGATSSTDTASSVAPLTAKNLHLSHMQDDLFLKEELILRLREHQQELAELQAQWWNMEAQEFEAHKSGADVDTDGHGAGGVEPDMVRWWHLQHDDASPSEASCSLDPGAFLTAR